MGVERLQNPSNKAHLAQQVPVRCELEPSVPPEEPLERRCAPEPFVQTEKPPAETSARCELGPWGLSEALPQHALADVAHGLRMNWR